MTDLLLYYFQTLRSEGEKSLPDMVVPQIVDNEIMITTDQFDSKLSLVSKVCAAL